MFYRLVAMMFIGGGLIVAAGMVEASQTVPLSIVAQAEPERKVSFVKDSSGRPVLMVQDPEKLLLDAAKNKSELKATKKDLVEAKEAEKKAGLALADIKRRLLEKERLLGDVSRELEERNKQNLSLSTALQEARRALDYVKASDAYQVGTGILNLAQHVVVTGVGGFAMMDAVSDFVFVGTIASTEKLHSLLRSGNAPFKKINSGAKVITIVPKAYFKEKNK